MRKGMEGSSFPTAVHFRAEGGVLLFSSPQPLCICRFHDELNLHCCLSSRPYRVHRMALMPGESGASTLIEWYHSNRRDDTKAAPASAIVVMATRNPGTDSSSESMLLSAGGGVATTPPSPTITLPNIPAAKCGSQA